MSKDATLGVWPGNPPKPHDLIVQIRAIAVNSGDVFFGTHAKQQLETRNLYDRDVIRGFRIGDVVGEVTPGTGAGEWKCEVIFPSGDDTGNRNIGVITIVQRGVRLFIKTVMWKDMS